VPLVTKDHAWLDRAKLTGEKIGVRLVKAVQEDKDLILFVQNDTLGDRAFSIWGDNKNRLIDKYGGNTDDWKDKRVFLHKEVTPEGKELVILTV